MILNPQGPTSLFRQFLVYGLFLLTPIGAHAAGAAQCADDSGG